MKERDFNRLVNVVILLYTDDKKVFQNAYKKVTGDRNGGSCWFHMYESKKISAKHKRE